MRKLLAMLATLAAINGAQAQINNPGFENWDTLSGGYYPQQWPLLSHSILERTADAHSGSYAVKVSVWYYYTETRVTQISPITYRPATFGGWYKYTDNIIKNMTTGLVTDDTAQARVYLTKWNTTTMRTDTVGSGRLDLGAAATYANFSCPISYVSTDVPDTVIVEVDPSLVGGAGSYFSNDSDGKNSYLTVDDLYLTSAPAAVAGSYKLGVKLWPNPVQNVLHLNFETACSRSIVVIDMAGRQVFSIISNNTTTDFDFNLLPGVYLLNVTENNTGVKFSTFVTKL